MDFFFKDVIQFLIRLIVGISCLFLSITALTFLYYSLHVFPSGDDWGFGVNAHNMMGNLGQMIHYYKKFHGRYFSHYLLPLSMNFDTNLDFYLSFVFSYYLFFLLSLYYFSHALLRKSSSIIEKIIVTLVLFSFFVMSQPAPNETFFWFSQICNYSINHLLFFLFCGLMLDFLNTPDEKEKRRSFLVTLMSCVSFLYNWHL